MIQNIVRSALVLAVLLVTACSGGPGTSGAGRGIAPSGDRPSLIYLLAAQRRDPSLQRAFMRERETCMRRRGFHVVQQQALEQFGDDVDVRAGFLPTRPTSLADAEEYGYGISISHQLGPDGQPEELPLDRYLSTLSRSASTAYLAAWSDCFNVAAASAYKGLPGPEVNKTLAAIEGRVAADAKVVAAQRRWAQCMGDAGYQYETHDAAYEGAKSAYAASRLPVGARAAENPEVARLQAAERALATADQRCYEQEVRVVESRVRRRAEDRVLDEQAWLAEDVRLALRGYERRSGAR